jgi:hypothetical protein
MNIVSQKSEAEKQLSTTIDKFFREFKIGSLLKQSNFYKESGVQCLTLLKYLFALIFSGKSLYYEMNHSNKPEFCKNVVYRYLNSVRYNWHKFVLLLASSVINKKIAGLTSEDRVNVFIVDDSLYERGRSKHVELLSRVLDHTDGKFKKGFRMLTLGWSDGNTFCPLSFAHISSEEKKNRYCEKSEDIDKRTTGYDNRITALRKSTDVMIDMLKQAVSYIGSTNYVLFDSWFCFPNTLIRIRELGLHTIAMMKSMKTVHYTYHGRRMSLNDIYESLYKNRGRAKILASVNVGLGTDSAGKEVLGKIVFVRDRNRRKKWLAIISTDISLSPEEIVRIYGKRWDIEVFFKMCKSYLKLQKEFQGLSYDCMVAHTAIVFSRYIMLALESRNNVDYRSWGDIFYLCCDQLHDIIFVDALRLILQLLKSILMDTLLLTKSQVDELLDQFIASLPAIFKEKMVLLQWEV